MLKKFKSKYADSEIGSAQFLAEIICERIAVKERKSLEIKFWNNPYWKRTFRVQTILANSLLKLYDVEAILRALHTNQGKRIYSLGAKFFDNMIQYEQLKLEKERQNSASSSGIPKEICVDIPLKNPKKSNADKLRNL